MHSSGSDSSNGANATPSGKTVPNRAYYSNDTNAAQNGKTVPNRAYYDEFANWYERERGFGYHQMLDDLEVDLVLRSIRDLESAALTSTGVAVQSPAAVATNEIHVLEVGCGTGLILEKIAPFVERATGIDVSPNMLDAAVARGLDVVQGNATQIPFDDATFDIVYSVKVLAHVADIRGALAEMARVTRPGGFVLAEFYNPWSLRYLVKRLKPASAVSERLTDHAVFTRYDSIAQIRRALPTSLRWIDTRGIRIVTPAAFVHRLPVAGALLRCVETRLADLPVLRRFGGFLVVVAQKR